MTIAGTDGCEILPELDHRPTDMTIVKKRYSAFFGTDLEATLKRVCPDMLVVAGINTHACISYDQRRDQWRLRGANSKTLEIFQS